MRKAAFILALIFCSGAVMGQSKSNLKGPAAKNYKPWKDKKETQKKVIIVKNEAQQLKGPAAKNAKPWNLNKTFITTTTDLVSNRKPILKGPAAKNYKPWKQVKNERSMAFVEEEFTQPKTENQKSKSSNVVGEEK